MKLIDNFIHSRAFIVMLIKTKQSLLDEFKKEDTKKFDASCMKKMSKGLNETISLLERTSEISNDRHVREFSKTSLAVMQRDLDM